MVKVYKTVHKIEGQCDFGFSNAIQAITTVTKYLATSKLFRTI